MRKRKLWFWLLAGPGILVFLAILLVILFRTPDIPVAQLKEKYGSKSSRYFPVMGMSVHFRDEGPPTDSVPLLLLHGNGSSLHTWDSLVKLLPGKRCIRLDLPGYGLTGAYTAGKASIGVTMAVIDSLLQFLAVDSCQIAGNSMGGWIAWNYAASHPSVKGLALIDASGFPMAKGQGGNLAFRIARIPVLNQVLKTITPRSIAAKSLRQSYGNPALVSEALIDRYYDIALREGNREALIQRSRNPESTDTLQLTRLQMPVLVLWGDQDRVIPVSHADRFMKLLPNAQKTIYTGVGHIPMEERPELVAASLRPWLLQRRP
jgi:pimeloyl-ACP methyl ester carboxylesterase